MNDESVTPSDVPSEAPQAPVAANAMQPPTEIPLKALASGPGNALFALDENGVMHKYAGGGRWSKAGNPIRATAETTSGKVEPDDTRPAPTPGTDEP